MKQPKISVIVPSFNQEKFLEETLLSVLDQNYPNLELIIIDGGSTDGSVEIIKRYEDRVSYWVSEPDGGQTPGLIKGFNRATGEIQCWLNSDDLHMPHTLKEVAEFFQKNPSADAVYGNTIWVDENTIPIREQREIPFNKFIWMYTYNYIPGQSMFWRSEIYKNVGGLDPNFNLAMDADLWIRFSEKGKIAHINRIWSKMRFYPEQKNRHFRDASDKEDLIIRKRYWGTETPGLYKQKRFIAYAVRTIWKAVSGCYTPGYKRYMES